MNATQSSPRSSAAAIEPKPRLARWFWVVGIVLLIFKLVLVSHDEIEIRSADDSGYAVCASVMYWGAPFQPYSYARQPGYPLFIMLAQVLGLPMRLAIEFVWFGAASALAASVRRCGLSTPSALAAFALTLFAPQSLWLFNRLLPDALYGAAIVTLVAGLAGAITARTSASAWRWGALGAFAAALSANTRQETPLTYGLIFVGAVLVALGAWRQWGSRAGERGPSVWKRLLAASLLPFAATLALTHAFAFANYRAVGMYVTYDLVAPGLKSLYRELLSIPPKNPRIDVPVPRDVRDIAYAHSPTFKLLEPFLDGDQDGENPYKVACKRFSGADGEFGAWTVWGLRRAAWRSVNYKWASGGEMDAMFAKAASELAAARRSGAIAHRRVLHEYLPPEYGQLHERLPSSLKLCWQHATSVAIKETDPDPQDPWYASRIDAAANRRIPTAQLTDHRTPPPPATWNEAGVVGAMDTIKQKCADIGMGFVRAGGWSALALVPIVVLLLFRSQAKPAAQGVIVLATLALAAITSRFLLFGVLDSCGIFSQSRYMFAASAMLPVCVVIAVEGLWHIVRPGAPARA